MAVRGSQEYLRAHNLSADSSALATAIQKWVKASFDTALDDAKQALDCGMGAVAEQTFAASMMQAGITAAKEVTEPAPAPAEVKEEESIFGEVISRYTRAQAIADGVLIDAMEGDFAEVSRQHFKYPIAMTAAVFAIIRKAVEHPKYCNDYKGVWHDILWMGRGLRGARQDQNLFRVKIMGAGRRNVFTFKMVCGPGDTAEPVLTLMLPEED